MAMTFWIAVCSSWLATFFCVPCVLYFFVLRPLIDLASWFAKTHKAISAPGFDSNTDRVFKRKNLTAAALQCAAWSAVFCIILAALFVFGAPWYLKSVFFAAAAVHLYKAFVFAHRDQKLQKEGLEEALSQYYEQNPPRN